MLRIFITDFTPGACDYGSWWCQAIRVSSVRLSSVLKDQGCFVHQVTDKESLIQLFTQKKQFDVVIVSDHFYVVGLGFFPLYFRAGNKKHRPYLIYLGKGEALGFDARLRSAFLPEELFSLFQ